MSSAPNQSHLIKSNSGKSNSNKSDKSNQAEDLQGLVINNDLTQLLLDDNSYQAVSGVYSHKN